MSPIKKIPLYDADGRILCKIDPAIATKNSPFFQVIWSRKAVKRQRPQHPLRAYLKGAPGFMRHIVECLRGSNESMARYGMGKEQQLSTGHVYALRGTAGSRDVDCV